MTGCSGAHDQVGQTLLRLALRLRLLLGSDSYAAAEKKRFDKIESDRNWKDLSLSS
jgi:hypothetical protein